VITKKGTDGWAFNVDDVQLQLDYTTPIVVPEPAAAGIVVAGLAGLPLLLRRRRPVADHRAGIA